MQDGQVRGRIAASARHLGKQHSWNGRKRKRTDAALEGCAKGLELGGELLDVNEKVGPSKNGLPGCAESRRMDAMMCRFLRVLLMVKALRWYGAQGLDKRRGARILAARAR